ncbi:MAG TPA: hypothetical protein DD412_06060 [Holosporales bacterium]|nr:hypothetical protein [Holosporales bacterium]
MVFKNKNAFTLALSLIIVPTSLVQASDQEESLLNNKSGIIQSNQSKPIVIPKKALRTIGLEPSIEIREFLRASKESNRLKMNQSGSASQAAAPMEEPRTTEEDE